MVADFAAFHPFQVRFKLGVSQQFQRFAWSQIERQTSSLGHLRIKNIDGLSRSQAVALENLFGAAFPSAVNSSTQESGFSHVLNLVPFVPGSSPGGNLFTTSILDPNGVTPLRVRHRLGCCLVAGRDAGLIWPCLRKLTPEIREVHPGIGEFRGIQSKKSRKTARMESNPEKIHRTSRGTGDRPSHRADY